MWTIQFASLLLLAACLVPNLAYGQESPPLAEGWDFVPGERLLLYDDFTDMPKGGSPPHWKVRGASVKLGTDGRLLITQESQLYPNVSSWPKNFTIQQEFAVHKSENSDLSWAFHSREDEPQWKMWIRFFAEGECSANLEGAGEELGTAACKYSDGQLNRLGLWMQDGRIRVYWNGERLIDVNQVKSQPIGKVWMEVSPGEGAGFSLANSRLAESSPDFSQTILSSGRFVTHGIQFDVNSDRLKPESMPILKIVSDAMTAQPALKLRIEGHTDSSGDAAKNLDLSKRRADSVKNALVTKFNIATGRLATEGFGATKPLSPNETPQGRANNRRVEFAKL